MSTTSTQQAAILLIGHGTRRATGVAEFHNLTRQLQAALPQRICQEAFLELAEPSVPQALEQLYQQGFKRITVLPAFLMAAGHIKEDIPALLSAFQAQYREVEIRHSAVLGIDQLLLQVAEQRIISIEQQCGSDYARNDTLLLVIGRGCSDTDANSNISKITRILWERMGFAWAETAYTAVAAPLMDEALERTHRLGFSRVIVFPYLLFDGRLVEQIHATVAAYQERHPQTPALVAPYLNAHPLVVATFLERLAQAENPATTTVLSH